MKKPDCKFCSIPLNGITPIFESDHFYVAPSLGQIVSGYLLICTKEHHLSLSHMPLEHFDELEEIQATVKAILSQNYSPPIFFEHGAMEKRQSVCCVDHAHLHCVPLGKDILEDIEKNFDPNERLYGQRKIKRLSSLPDQKRMNRPYYYYESQDGERHVFDLKPPYPPSQFIRQLVAIAVGKPDQWDWRTNPTEEECEKVADNLRNKVFPKREIFLTLAEQDFPKLKKQIESFPGLIYQTELPTGPFEGNSSVFVYSIQGSPVILSLSVSHKPDCLMTFRFISTPDLEKLVRNHFDISNIPKRYSSKNETYRFRDVRTSSPIPLNLDGMLRVYKKY